MAAPKPGMLLADVRGRYLFLVLRRLTPDETHGATRLANGGWLVLDGENQLRLSDSYLTHYCQEIV